VSCTQNFQLDLTQMLISLMNTLTQSLKDKSVVVLTGAAIDLRSAQPGEIIMERHQWLSQEFSLGVWVDTTQVPQSGPRAKPYSRASGEWCLSAQAEAVCRHYWVQLNLSQTSQSDTYHKAKIHYQFDMFQIKSNQVCLFTDFDCRNDQNLKMSHKSLLAYLEYV